MPSPINNLVALANKQANMTYILQGLKIRAASRLKQELEGTISNLVALAQRDCGFSMRLQRLPRRSVRITRNASPFGRGYSKRAYVFHDYSYQFDLTDISDPQSCVSQVLGSLSGDSNYDVKFCWFSQGCKSVDPQCHADMESQLIVAYQKFKGRV